MSKPLRVLVVEDSEDDTLLLIRKLRQATYNPTYERVESAEAMQAALDRHPWDVVISDYTMPHFNASMALDLLQASGFDIPFIIVSGTIGEERAVAVMKAGAHDYLMKGNLARLPPIIERELREAQMRRERRQAEEALRASEERYRALYQDNPSMFFTLDAAGTIISVNQFGASQLGYTGAELEGQPVSKVFDEADRAVMVEQLQNCLQQLDQVHYWQLRKVRKDGSRLWVEEFARAVRNPEGEINVLVVCHDITERKQAEESLRQEEERFRYVALATRDAIYDWDIGGNMVWRNEAYQRLYGPPDEPVDPDESWWEQHLHPGDRSRVLAGIEQAFREGRHFWSDEYQFCQFDDNYATVIDRGYILYDQAGQPARMIGAITDMTERKRLEAQFLQAQKMEAIGHLTAGIAHDFNNLLTAINGFAELMQMKLLIGDPLHEMVGKILHAGQRAANLVRQLLTFSRKQIIDPEILDLNIIVTGMGQMLQRIIGEHIQMTTSLTPGLWPIQADPSQMEQIIVNLAVNARDAMPSGGRLLIETSNVFLDEEFVATHLEAQPGPHVLLAISDTGSGMSETVKAHLFEPFFTTKEMGKGTGLGLATVYGIVKQSGGGIWVYSEVGQGTTFKIYLPRAEGTEMPVSALKVETEKPTGSETILLVEDAASVRDLTQRMLEGLGYNLLVASNGPAALELADRHPEPIHLLLTDVVMPGLSGKALAEKLTSTRPGLKVLFMSGYTDEAIAHHGMLAPHTFLLQKPFSALDLAHKVREVLDTDRVAEGHLPDRGGN